MLHKKPYFLFYIIPVPLFFTMSGAIFRGKSIGDHTFALPVSLILYLVLFFLDRQYARVLFSRKALLPFSLLLFGILALSLKVIFSDSSADPNMLLISTVPLLLSFSAGYRLKPQMIENGDIVKVVDRAIVIFAFFCLLHLASSFVSYGPVKTFYYRGEDSIFGLFSVYQKLIYYPTMTSMFFIFSLFSTLKYKRLFSILFFVVILMTAAREALLISLVGLAVYFRKTMKIDMRFFLKLSGVIAVVLVSTYIFRDTLSEIFESATIVEKTMSLGEKGDAGRSESIHIVFSRSAEAFNPVIGTGYSMNLGMFNSPHNQYLEILLRSGAIGLLLFLLFVMKVIDCIRINIRRYGNTAFSTYIYGFAVAYFCLLVISFNVNTPIRAPYSAMLFGFISGFFYNNDNVKIINC